LIKDIAHKSDVVCYGQLTEARSLSIIMFLVLNVAVTNYVA